MPWNQLAAMLGSGDNVSGKVEPSYNVAPTDTVAAAIERKGERKLVAVRWGLVPSWAKDPRIGSKLINARVETIAEKPAFRSAYQRRRCLIPADGYYEWEPAETPKGPKQPFYLHPKDGRPLMFAGLYEIWKDVEGVPLWTCTIVTTDAADELGHIHDRTPMTIAPDAWGEWLSQDVTDPSDLLTPAMDGQLEATKVSTLVNNVRNNGPELMEPA